MSQVIDFAAQRRQRQDAEQRRRQEAFDRELSRRLAAFLDGRPIPAERIADNPYLGG
ncbi:MAG TPA: hypothetical protein VEH84_10260 [Alphaproteobacteria bacterium]|nr:hypothetical protein [Alphaproteobacteria bacterium]